MYFQKMFAKFLIFSSSPKALKNPVLANFLRRRRVFEKIGIFRHFWTVLAKISRFFCLPSPSNEVSEAVFRCKNYCNLKT